MNVSHAMPEVVGPDPDPDLGRHRTRLPGLAADAVVDLLSHPVIAVTMDYTTLVIGHLNIITITFAVMILGLGESGRANSSLVTRRTDPDRNRFDAVRGALNSTLPAFIIAGVTNAAAFFGWCSAVQGRGRIGHYRGRGMLVGTLGMTVLLPRCCERAAPQ